MPQKTIIMKKILLQGCLFLGIVILPLKAEVYPLMLYRNYKDAVPERGLLIGKINTKGTDNSVPPQQILGYDARMAVISATIDNSAHVYPGMKVYVVKRERNHTENKAALIIAEGEIDSVSATVFQGRMVRIRGQFSMVSRQFFIAAPVLSHSIEGETGTAAEYLLQAERFRHENDLARAAQALQHAREIEPRNPLVALRYAELALMNDAPEKARMALQKAFAERRRLENVNDYLNLGALYLKLEVDNIPTQNQGVLKTGTHLLAQMRQFEKDMGQFGADLTPPKSRRMRRKQTHFSANYHLNYGRLLVQIAAAMREYSPESITKILVFAERDALYAPIETRIATHRTLALPRKAWDKAYTDAAITHFELALKKDRHSEAAYELIQLCDREWDGADNNRRTYLKQIVTQYATQYLEKAHEDYRMGRVRSVLNKVNQA